jgi:voltage-gated potassium channel
MLVRYFFGRSGRITRKIAVEVYVVLKTVFAVVVLFWGLWHQRWFAWVAIPMLVDLFSFISALILLRGFWRSPISLNRTIILIGFNFFEYTAWFAGLYLCFSGLRAGYEIITDPAAAFYFSVVTAATVGYGDITPIGAGRTLATFQIVASLGFMGAVVAYFIGSLERQKPDAEPPNA